MTQAESGCRQIPCRATERVQGTFTLKYQLADDNRDEAGSHWNSPVRRTVLARLCAERSALASARLIELAPDLVGLTDEAEMVGVSRQNMRKLMRSHPSRFPAPGHEGSASIWHLADVLIWRQAKGSYALARNVLEVAQVALQVNVVTEGQRLPRPASKELQALVG
jgi:hypothetical protein